MIVLVGGFMQLNHNINITHIFQQFVKKSIQRLFTDENNIFVK